MTLSTKTFWIRSCIQRMIKCDVILNPSPIAKSSLRQGNINIFFVFFRPGLVETIFMVPGQLLSLILARLHQKVADPCSRQCCQLSYLVSKSRHFFSPFRYQFLRLDPSY